MRVSAIVPTFNRAHLIPRAIESILGQTHPDIEIIVVDDGSTDATEEVVKKYQAGPRPLTYVKQPNRGCASARNRGIEQATGELIGFLDSDDEWLSGAIRSLADALESSGADFVYSPAIEHVTDAVIFASPPAAAGRPEDFAVEHFMTTRARPGSSLYRKRVFERVRFDETTRYNEDSDFLQRVALNFKAAYCDTPTSVFHHHGGNKSKNAVEIARALLRSSEAILREYPDFERTLGTRAAERRHQIRRELVQALLTRGEVAEARAEAAGDRFGVPLDLWLRLGWGFPLQLRSRMAEARFFLQCMLLKTVAPWRRRAAWR